MSTAAAEGRRSGFGRLDPTVRSLLRAFLSPAVADRYASALQPVATADRDAALAGAVTALRARFYVPVEELAVVLVEDTGWAVADVATMLGMPALEVRSALRDAAAARPRIGAPPPPDLDADEVAMVEAMLADLPSARRSATAAAERDPPEEPVDVELHSALPTGGSATDERIRRADRLQARVVRLTIMGVAALVALALVATTSEDPDVVPAPVVPSTPTPSASGTGTPTAATPGPATPTPGGGSASPGSSPGPTPTPSALPRGPVEVTGARFVATVDPRTGEPGATIDTAAVDADPRLWFRLDQLPEDELILEVAFTAPSGRTTLRPVLVDGSTPQVALRLPDELGRDPGRYAARIEVDGELVGATEIQLEPPDEE